MTLDRAALVALVEVRYFGNVAAGDIEATRACFTDDAEVLIRHGDGPPRRLVGTPGPGESPLEDFWRHLCGNYRPSFGDFGHVVDEPAQRIASTFTVTLEPHAGTPLAARGTQRLRNCNFFQLRDGRIAGMLVYYSNADAPAGTGAPTGYPPPGWRPAHEDGGPAR